MLPIYKKDKFEKMDKAKQTIAESVTTSDKAEIKRLMNLFRSRRDARGNWYKPEKELRELLVYFKKYVDKNASNNVLGCGGCGNKILNFMNDIYLIWQSPTK